MATPTDIPDLSDDKKALVFRDLDVNLNQTILFAFLLGIYIGMVAFTLWKIFSRRRGAGTNVMALVIVVLCILTAVDFAIFWLAAVYSFIQHGQNFWTAKGSLDSPYESGIPKFLELCPGVLGCICTIITDSTMVWRCWIVWGRRWRIVLLPLVFMAIGTVFKIFQIRANVQVTESAISVDTSTAIYISFILATTLLCTVLIVYRILSIEWAKSTSEGTRTFSFGPYRNTVEIIVESAALYSVTSIVYVIFIFQDGLDAGYLNTIAKIIKGVAPTLLVGRVVSGHSRTDDSWRGSAVTSLRFGTGRPNQTSAEMSAEEDLTRGDDFVHDLEAQALASQLDEEKVNAREHAELEPVADKGV